MDNADFRDAAPGSTGNRGRHLGGSPRARLRFDERRSSCELSHLSELSDTTCMRFKISNLPRPASYTQMYVYVYVFVCVYCQNRPLSSETLAC